MTISKAVKHINSRGVLLTFPMNNQKEPRSLWTEFFPRKKMVWEWDEDGDASVAKLWHLRTELSESREVVYAKWYQGRATFFSTEFYVAALALMQANGFFRNSLSRQARDILDLLEEDSPLSTKVLKKRADLMGKDNQRVLRPRFEATLGSFFNRGLWRSRRRSFSVARSGFNQEFI